MEHVVHDIKNHTTSTIQRFLGGILVDIRGGERDAWKPLLAEVFNAILPLSDGMFPNKQTEDQCAAALRSLDEKCARLLTSGIY